MSAAPFVNAVLADTPAVAEIVGGVAGIHYTAARQGAVAPYLVLVGSGGDEPDMLAGASGWPEGFCDVIAVGRTFTEVEDLGNAVIGALRDHDGEWNGKAFQVWREPVDSFDYVQDTEQHRRVLSFRLRYQHG